MSENNEDWVELDNTREMKKMNEGNVILVAPKEQRDFVVPLFCPLCLLPMKTQQDSEAYLADKTCHACHKTWANIEPIDFKSNEWKEYMEQRELLAKTILNIV